MVVSLKTRIVFVIHAKMEVASNYPGCLLLAEESSLEKDFAFENEFNGIEEDRDYLNNM